MCAVDYPFLLKAEMGKEYWNCMMTFYPKQPKGEMGKKWKRLPKTALR